MSWPLAYFITWTTHGTRLHGDERGSVDRHHNAPDSPKLAPSERREIASLLLLTSPILTLSSQMRVDVDAAIRGVFTHRAWTLHALDVRSNHVHLVATGECDPERIMQDCKSWDTRALRDTRAISPTQTAWTRHGSTIYLWTPDKLAEKIDYVLRLQDEPARFKTEPPASARGASAQPAPTNSHAPDRGG